MHTEMTTASSDAAVSVHIHGLVQSLMDRQQRAQAVASKRFQLRQKALLQQNIKLAAALGLRAYFAVGERVWIYRAPVTHQALTTTGARAQLSRKFLNLWQGPYEVLCVGPGSIGSGPDAMLVGEKCLLIMRDGSPQRVSVQLCKRCRDPADLADRPTGLPTGFARYLLANPHSMATAPTSLDDNEATWESDRHGVEAVVDH